MIERLRGFYGAHPLHLAAVLGCLALAGLAAVRTTVNPAWAWMAVWFAAAIVAHDLVLFPAYAAADRALVGTLGARVNYVRIPLLGCGLTFLLFFPGIVRQGAFWYRAATGQDQEPYLARWLMLCVALFAASALTLVTRTLLDHRR